jgi:hypothetical protein
MSFAQKNTNRSTGRAILVAKHGERDGNRLFREYRADRRQRLDNGAFGSLDTQDFNHYVIGTTGVERSDEGDAEG